jgi:hypothetical protein
MKLMTREKTSSYFLVIGVSVEVDKADFSFSWQEVSRSDVGNGGR